MNFTSDNITGASARVLAAIMAANEGAMPSYGADALARSVAETMTRIFEREVSVFLVTTGTAANALAIAAMVPPYGALACHEEAHVIDDECGAPEFFMGGGKLVGIAAPGGKLTAERLAAMLADEPGGTNHPPVRGLSLSQATECGTVYHPDEIAALAEVAHRNGMAVHMDGARFANALVSLGCTPADMTWKAGVDCLSFGGTKNGCLMAEAVVFFDPALARDFAYRRKRAGQTVSKGRLLSAQFAAYLAEDHWLDLARHANRQAARLSQGMAGLAGARLAWPTEANEVFVILTRALADSLRAGGAAFYEWTARSLPPAVTLGPDEAVFRLVTSFATRDEDVVSFLDLARSNLVQAACST